MLMDFFSLLSVPATKLILTVSYVGFDPMGIVVEDEFDITDLQILLSEKVRLGYM